MAYIWVLRCPGCRVSFAPDEEDWDGPIVCPKCGLIDVIAHDNYDALEEPLLKVVPPEPPEAA